MSESPSADEPATEESPADRSALDEMRPGEVRAPNTVLNAVIGGVVGIVLSFVPFSTVIGGAVAGYLEGGETGDGAKVGLLAGLVAMVPILFLFVVALFFVPIMGPGPGAQFGMGLVFLVGLFAVAVYVVGFSLIGGILGVYLRDEFGRESNASTRRR